MKNISIFLLLIVSSICSYAQSWAKPTTENLYNITSAYPVVYCMALSDTNLYVAGVFQYAGNYLANSVALLKNNSWLNLDNGVQNAFDVRCIYSYKGNVYIGGNFWHASNVPNTKYLAMWDGTNWNSVGGVIPNYTVLAMCEYKDQLYVSGNFSKIGDTYCNGIARWNGSVWDTLDGWGGSGNRAMCVYNNDLWIGGDWDIGNLHTYGVARWNGSEWLPVLPGLYGYVNDLVVDSINNFLYVGGAVDINGIVTFNTVARYDGYQWDTLLSGIDSDVYSLCMYRNELYIGGSFDSINGTPLNHIVRYDGINRHHLTSGINWIADDMIVYHDTLVVGGGFNIAGGDTAWAIAAWYMPPDSVGCNYLLPRVHADSDTFYLNNGSVQVQFYNNNAYSPYWQWDFGDSGTGSVQNPVHTYTDTGVYTVQVTVANEGCTKTAEKQITILNPLSVSQLATSNNQLTIYPNPADSRFTIETRISQGSIGEIKVYGIKGQKLKTVTIKTGTQTTAIDVSGWQKGNYVCSLYVDGKLVKSKTMVVK